MANKVKLVAFAGSTRTESFNKKLVKIAVEGARTAGADVTHIDLRDYEMPLYDGDLEAREGLPPQARRFKELLVSSHGFIISSPEYNSSISGVLKNAIDWASRPQPGEPSLVAFTGKTAVLMSASPGALGGLRGLVHLRAILSNINVLVLPQQQAISKAGEAFSPDGSLKDAKMQQGVTDLGRRLAEMTGKLLTA
ncbi:MAG TPA: NAD(P)H-dependent oxidoreductase [Phycisphaerae bacterium]|nr:NAD(P)H-dependent oxidoreductase [Phycisphaerae bacterium]